MQIISTKRYKYLKAWRKYFKFSQKKLAEILNTNQPNIARWENGTQAFDDNTFEKIAKTFGIEPIKLLVDPEQASTLNFLTKIYDIINRMDNETRSQWVSLGEKLANKE